MIPNVPYQTRLGDVLAQAWREFFRAVHDACSAAPEVVGTVTLSGQTAAISATAVATPPLESGLYRISYRVRVTQAAGTSSSLTPTIGWTSGGVSCSQSGAAVTGNTTASLESGTIIARVDAGTTITYATAYASVGSPSMHYNLDVIAEQIG